MNIRSLLLIMGLAWVFAGCPAKKSDTGTAGSATSPAQPSSAPAEQPDTDEGGW